jgi:hypothetical protein
MKWSWNSKEHRKSAFGSRRNCIVRWRKSVSEKNSVKTRGKKNTVAKKLKNITKLNWSISKPKRSVKEKDRDTTICLGNNKRKNNGDSKNTKESKSTKESRRGFTKNKFLENKKRLV